MESEAELEEQISNIRQRLSFIKREKTDLETELGYINLKLDNLKQKVKEKKYHE
jgi:chromosome segregation ATPase